MLECCHCKLNQVAPFPLFHPPGLPALVVALLTTRAAPAVSLSFPPSYQVPPVLRDPKTCKSFATAEAHSKVFPQVDVQMVDRCASLSNGNIQQWCVCHFTHIIELPWKISLCASAVGLACQIALSTLL